MRSFGLLHTNVALTTNIQIMVSPDYHLYMESIDSNGEMSSDRFKKVEFKKDANFDKLIPRFYRDLSPKYAFEVKYDEDNDEMFDDYSKQFDDTYQMGCSNFTNINYNEEFSCFAPLHFEKNDFPEGFFVFRCDGPGLIDITKDNFRENILNNLKCVQYFNMTEESPLGEWIENSFKNERDFPEFKFNFDVRDDEFSEWSGIDYESGGYTTKSLFMKDLLETENTFFDLEKTITSGYQENKIVYPNIINFNFLFDDLPATKNNLRKWSINRYYGFYINKLENIKNITPYSPPIIHSGFEIEDNIIKSTHKDPFVRGYKKDKTFIEYNGEFYQVKINNSGEYKIISPFDLTGKENLINKEIIDINENNEILYNPKFNTIDFNINEFEDADIWVININDKYHRIIKNENNKYTILTDYGFFINNNKLEYWINETDDSFRTIIDLNKINSDNPPMTFSIYRLDLTDIKDFDNNLIETGFNRYEYEKKESISNTLEPKSFKIKPTESNINIEFNEYIFGNELVNIPTSSEYIGNSELFEIVNPNNTEISDLSSIWRKNPIFTKWGYEGSLNNSDYPYRLNNSFYAEDLNKSTNVYKQSPSRTERNLDYFYTINPDNNSYIDHTLHISDVDSDGNINLDFDFDLDKYFNFGTVSCGTMSNIEVYNNNYFDYLFSKKEKLDNGNIIRTTNKYSYILKGDDDIPNMTLFRGIKFKIFKVDKVNTSLTQLGDRTIDDISVLSSNMFENWKFSIILSDLKYDPDNNFDLINNNSEWDIIDKWKTGETYTQNDIVLYQSILYVALNDSIIESTSDNPAISSDWSLYNDNNQSFDTPFWNPNINYNLNDWVSMYGEYYIYDDNGITDFYNPSISYSVDDYVIYNNDYYKSLISNNTSIPKSKKWIKVNENEVSSLKWNKVTLWSPNITYNSNTYVYYQGTLYLTTSSNNLNNIPNESNQWDRIHSFTPEDITYGQDKQNNNIIFLNNKYYLSSEDGNTLNNGINVYINKKWKNILIQIYIDDNTTPNIKNSNRDILYDSINEKITAYNFIACLNDISEKRQFVNFLNYYVIEEDLTYIKYNMSNIEDIPYIISAEDPDEFDCLIGSLKRSTIKINENILKPNFKLKNNEIGNVNELNYYNNEAISTSIVQVTDDEKEKLTTKSTLFRFNGNYSPIFKEIELFKRPTLCCNIVGNYQFDEELSLFGQIQEKVLSKVNLKDNIFKLKDKKSMKSIYPKLDEFGYFVSNHNIFKSTWDRKFYTLVDKNKT